MRRSAYSFIPLLIAIAPLLTACEDGPNQTFQPATGILFNSGDTPAAVSDAGNPLSSTFGGSTKTQICGGEEMHRQWAAMVSQPVAPVRFLAGIDLVNGPTYPLLSIEQTETGPLYPIQNACVSEPPPKLPTDGYYGATPGAAPSPTDPCLYKPGTKTMSTQKECAALAQSGKNCGWNVIPNPTANLDTNPPAPTRLCQPVNDGPGANAPEVGGSIQEHWGNSGELQMEWAIPTHKAYVLTMNPGYAGHMTWNYLDPVSKSVDTYDWQVGSTIKRAVGANVASSYAIDWNAPNPKTYLAQLDVLYRGVASTYAPDIYDDAPAGVTCDVTGTCLSYKDVGDGTGLALFGMRPVSFYMFFDPPSLPNPSGYTVNSSYVVNIKYTPYSGARTYLKMFDPDASAAQPYADGLVGNLPTPAHCHFSMGDTFQNLLTNCIDVFALPSGCKRGDTCDPNLSAENKVLGDLAHDDQNYSFSVVGVNQNFRPLKLDVCTPALKAAGTNCGTDTEDVIHDSDSPVKDAANLLANNYQMDVRSFGAILNDSYPDKTVPGVFHKDYHGSGAVWREYARMVQADMAAHYSAAHPGTVPKSWHDPSCYFPMVCTDGGPLGACGDGAGKLKLGPRMEMSPLTSCTGAANGASDDCAAADPKATCYTAATGGGLLANTCTVPFAVNSWRPAPGCTGFESFISSAEKIKNDVAQTPADDLWDLGAADSHGGGFKPGTPKVMFCNDPGMNIFCGLSGDIQGLAGDLLGASAHRLLTYLGHGDPLALPLEGRDRRYFFEQWSVAYAKYVTSPHVLDTGLASAGVPGYNGNQVGDFSAQPIDLDNFIFDAFGGGESRSEFVDFDTADENNDPLDIEHRMLLISSNLKSTNFYRKLDREERAVFNALAVDKTQASWGYLRTAAGDVVYDTWLTDAQPATKPCSQAQCDALGVQNAVCDVDPNDPDVGYCVRQFPRRNASTFLTSMAGSAALAGLYANVTTGSPPHLVPAPPGWVDPCNPISAAAGVVCARDSDCPGVMSCDTTTHACRAATTAYFCATHAASDPTGAGAACISSTAPLNAAPIHRDGSMIRRANGKPLLEGYCGVWQPGPFALTTNAVTPSSSFPSAKNVNLAGVAAGIQVLKTFPSIGEALVTLPTFPNPYDANPATSQKPAAVMVPWLPFQEGIGYPVAASGSTDVFVKTAQLDFAGQIVTPVVDFLPVPFSCSANADCSGGLTCQAGQCLAAAGAPLTNPAPPYGLSIQAIETQDFLGDVFLCVDAVTTANNTAKGVRSPGDILTAHMYSSAEMIIDWLATHPGAQTHCGIIVRYSVYDNYPDYITSLTSGVRLNIEQGSGFGRVSDATVFAPGSGALASP